MNKIVLILSVIIFIIFNQIIKLNANDETYINSSNIIYNEKDNIVELAENSKINIGNTNIQIDRGIIDYNNNKFEVYGNFYLYQGSNILSGKNLSGDVSLDKFNSIEVNYIYNEDLKIDSKEVVRNSNNLFFYDNFLTPCKIDGYFNCPTWSLRIDKTEYNIEQDQFIHYDSFLQIADKKLFYIPYFSHYGSKAPRKSGFLSPTIEFTIGGGQSIRTPYYIPLSRSSDLLLTPKFFFDENFEFLENYNLNTIFENRSAGGKTKVLIDNIKTYKSNDINSTLKITTEQILDKESVFSASGLFTNSISTSRSINSEPITFEDLYLKFENYNFLQKNDYLKSEIYSVYSFDSTNTSLIPLSPSLNYHNTNLIYDSLLMSNLDFTILKRQESNNDAASEGIKINLSNELFINKINKKTTIYNKINFNNSYSDYHFNNNSLLDKDTFKSNLVYSSDIYFNSLNIFSPRVKFIIPYELENSDKTINEDSNSLTFNYFSQLSENRLFGNDLVDNSPRVIAGIESIINIRDAEVSFGINQSYDFNKNNNYSNLINQKNNLSDYSIIAKTDFKDFSFGIDTRLDENSLSKKEMNYSINSNKFIDLEITYNETRMEAYKKLSGDSKSINFNLGKEINNNVSFSYETKIDLQNDYNPFSSSLNLNIFDECSRLSIGYSNTRFNDSFNTQPSETINFTFHMDYLGFFGYQQSTDLLFEEPGAINYGL